MGKRILFVEDDANFREVFGHALRQALAPERLDVAFVEAGSLAEARAQLRQGGLDAALIDVTMPDGNGLDLVEEIHNGAFSKLASMPETVDAIKRLTDAGRSEV
jgi:CheY-like chemotaxis protein